MLNIPRNTACSIFTYADDFSLNAFKDVVDHKNVSPLAEIEFDTTKRKAFGFVNPHDYLDDTYKMEIYGKYYVVSYAQCSRSVSSKSVEYAVRKARREKGGRLSRDERDVIKSELLRDAPIQVKTYLSVIDPEFRRVYLLSASNAIRDAFVASFSAITGMQLYEESFTTYLVDTDNSEILDTDTNVTGSFFTWLWYSAESNSYKEYAPKNSDNTYLFVPGAKIKVGNAAGDSCRVSGDIREARNGIFNGKVVEDFSFTLNASNGTTYDVTVYDYDRITRTRLLPLTEPVENEEAEAEALVYLVIGQIDTIREALLTAFNEYLDVLKTRGRNGIALEIFNWSKGDVCIKAFEEV